MWEGNCGGHSHSLCRSQHVRSAPVPSPNSCCHPHSLLACPLPPQPVQHCHVPREGAGGAAKSPSGCTSSSVVAPRSKESPTMSGPSCLHPGAHRFSKNPTPTPSPSCFGMCWWQHIDCYVSQGYFRRIFRVTGTAGGLPASTPHLAVLCQRVQPPAAVPMHNLFLTQGVPPCLSATPCPGSHLPSPFLGGSKHLSAPC